MASVLVTGTTGLVGSCLYQYLKKNTEWDVIGTSRSKGHFVDYTADLEDRDCVENLKSQYSFDSIIHTAALTKTDLCEKFKAECTSANVGATRNLVKSFPTSKFIFFSTYAVYNTPQGNCSEESPVFPTNHYISTKIDAERLVNTLEKSIILRPSVIFGYLPFTRESKNYFMQLLDNIQKKSVMRSPIDQFFNPIHVRSVTEIVLRLIKQNSEGIFNIGSNETISKYEFNQRIIRRFKYDELLLEGIESRSLQVTRPNNGTISSKKIQSVLSYTIPPLDQMIDALYDSSRKNLVKNDSFH